MTAPLFKKAERSQVYLKLAITGPTGSGKTFSALRLAIGLLAGTDKRIAFIDTENDSASLYAPSDGGIADGVKTFDFDVLPIAPPFEHDKFITGIRAAVEAGYGVAIIDSSSHFWEGILEYKSRLDSRPGSNSYTNWNEAGKKFQGIIDALLQSKIHIICCMRSKMDYVLEDNGKGKQVPKRVGLAPIMRDGVDYEFTTVFDIALNHEAATSKDRSGLFTDKIFQITEDTGREIAGWLKTAKEKPVEPTKPEPTEEERKTKALAMFLDFFTEQAPLVKTDVADYTKSFTTLAWNGAIPSMADFSLNELLAVWPKRKEIAAELSKINSKR